MPANAGRSGCRSGPSPLQKRISQGQSICVKQFTWRLKVLLPRLRLRPGRPRQQSRKILPLMVLRLCCRRRPQAIARSRQRKPWGERAWRADETEQVAIPLRGMLARGLLLRARCSPSAEDSPRAWTHPASLRAREPANGESGIFEIGRESLVAMGRFRMTLKPFREGEKSTGRHFGRTLTHRSLPTSRSDLGCCVGESSL